MPSGRTHDALTILLAAPAAVITYAFTFDLPFTAIVAISFIFAGVMFGPDLDTKSKQYSRWGPLRLVWLPYRTVFPHRSRWSHGLIFGTLFRVIYFLGVTSLLAFAAVTLYAYADSGNPPELAGVASGWRTLGAYFGGKSTFEILTAVFVGMWLGAASHTLTDIAITYIKTGRVNALF